MKTTFFTLLLFVAACRTTSGGSYVKGEELPALPLSADIYDTEALPVPTKATDNYLAMAIPFAPVHALKPQLEKDTGLHLQDRGEAHITVITPPEFAVLKTKVTMAEILGLAHELQSAGINAVCVGRGKKDQMQTFFVVVDAPELVAVRQAVDELFQQRGGAENAFDPEKFYPHITIGFTDRDLHLEDGVVKDESSCVARLVPSGV